MKFIRILENIINNESIALFPGKFKPPHLEHLYTIEQACKSADSLIIFISRKRYDNWSANLSKQILEELLHDKDYKNKVQIKIAQEKTPIDDFRNYLKNNLLPNKVYLVKGAKETAEDTRFDRTPIEQALQSNKNINYKNITIEDLIIKPQKKNPISSTDIRNGSYATIEEMFEYYKYIPSDKLIELYKQGFLK
jgi:cytidyltransferase-like protein